MLTRRHPLNPISLALFLRGSPKNWPFGVRQIADQQIIDHAFDGPAERQEPVLMPRQVFCHVQWIDHFRPPREELLQLFGEDDDVLIGGPVEAIAKTVLENQLAHTHDLIS